MFPYIDEYWELSDYSELNQIFKNSDYFENKSIFFQNLLRSLNENFRNVTTPNTFKELYYNKFNNLYWDTFSEENKVFLPMIPSFSILQKEIIKTINSKTNKIFLFPSQTINYWNNGRYIKLQAPKSFYTELISYLKENNIYPILWNSNFSHDLNNEFKNETDVLFINSNNINEILPVIRLAGLCVDIFNDISKLSLISRTPYLNLTERSKYFSTREYEIEDLLNLNLPNKKIFTFANSVLKGNKDYWRKELFSIISKFCEETLPYIDREKLPNTSEVNIDLDVSLIRKIKNKRLGSRFVKVEKLI
jgi:hypothetical protein